jgi:D-arabinose 1-dehydrogenase-like Zn-dependent alcohol dehydrogenase
MCAGVTTFNALRHAHALPGDLVAIEAIGGLGHLGVQFANKFGYRTVAIARGEESKELALKLGAHAYIDSDATNPAEELQKMGGAKAILSTVPSGKAMTSVFDGLGDNGKLMVIGASAEPIEVSPAQLIKSMRSIQGWAAGVAADSEDTLGFCMLTGVRPMIEKYPLEQAQQAYDRMMSGHAHFRVVLTMGS